MPRAIGIASGVATHAIFAVTVYFLFQFLHAPQAASGPLWIDAALALQFCLPHSLLLHPRVRSRIEPFIGAAFYGLFFCVITCLHLLLIFRFWQSSPQMVWQFEGRGGLLIEACFYGSWLALIYSLWLTGLGYQTGLTPWLYWVRGEKAPRRDFQPRGAYRWLRHPVYLSFLGLIWFHPTLTADKLVLVAIWTPYIFIGSMLKDYRLRFYLKDRYRDYEARVAGYPGVWFGPLGRVPREQARDFSTPSGLQQGEGLGPLPAAN